MFILSPGPPLGGIIGKGQGGVRHTLDGLMQDPTPTTAARSCRPIAIRYDPMTKPRRLGGTSQERYTAAYLNRPLAMVAYATRANDSPKSGARARAISCGTVKKPTDDDTSR